jgi:hypothetical protein
VYESPGLRLALHYGDGGAAAAGVAAAGSGVRAWLRPPPEGKSSGSGSGERQRSTGNSVFRSLIVLVLWISTGCVSLFLWEMLTKTGSKKRKSRKSLRR